MTVLQIAPVTHVRCSIGTIRERHAQKRLIRCVHEIVTRIQSLVTRAFALVVLVVELAPKEIVSENLVSVNIRPVIPEINHGAGMGVATIDRIGARFPGATFSTVVAR